MTRKGALYRTSSLAIVTWISGLACGGLSGQGDIGSGGISANAASGGSPPGGAASGGSAAGGAKGAAPSGGGSDGAATGGAATAGESGIGGGEGTGGAASVAPDVPTVQLQELRQLIRGFGMNGAFSSSNSAVPWDQLFTLEGANALGLSILRVEMTEDGAAESSMPADWRTVKDFGARIIGTSRSAPANWKDNNSLTGGGHLLPDYYDDWATRLALFAADTGLYAMSIAHQPDFASCDLNQGIPCDPPLEFSMQSMVYTGWELAAFAAVAGPIFEARAPDTLIIAGEPWSWIHLWSNLSPTGKGVEGARDGGYNSPDPLGCHCFSNVIDAAAPDYCTIPCQAPGAGEPAQGGYDYGHWLARDPAVWAGVDILGVQQFGSQIGYAWPIDVADGKRDKEIWQTEMSGQKYWPEEGPSKDIQNGVAVARWIHSALTVGEASAWLYATYDSPFFEENVGLAHVKGDSSSATPAKRYFTLGNFSRFIRPDVFHAVKVAGPVPEQVLVSAYKGTGGELVIVAINETEQEVQSPLAIAGGTPPSAMIPYLTSAESNWAEHTPVPVTDGSLQLLLPAMSVTTFVSQ